MAWVVGVDVQVLHRGARLPVGHVVAALEVEGDVEEDGDGGVALGLHLQVVGGKDGDYLLHGLMHTWDQNMYQEKKNPLW